jgi:ParB family transcriptional regulator, chromosome partitioning protein
MRLPWHKGPAQQLDLLSLDALSQTTAPDEAATRLEPIEPKQSPSTKTATRGVPLRVPGTSIDEDPNNPRTEFLEAEIDELADDIRQRGILQPLVVHPADAQGRYRLHFGAK